MPHSFEQTLKIILLYELSTELNEFASSSVEVPDASYSLAPAPEMPGCGSPTPGILVCSSSHSVVFAFSDQIATSGFETSTHLSCMCLVECSLAFPGVAFLFFSSH